MTFRIKPTTPMAKLMDIYSKKHGRSDASMRFVFDGARLARDSTAEELGMEDGDNIDVFEEQVGGGSSASL